MMQALVCALLAIIHVGLPLVLGLVAHHVEAAMLLLLEDQFQQVTYVLAWIDTTT